MSTDDPDPPSRQEVIDELIKVVEEGRFEAVQLELPLDGEYVLNENGEVIADVKRIKKCECGADAVKSPHSSWCPKYVK